MINAIHTMIFAEDADRTRAVLRDVLKLDHVDAGEGWLIFALPPAEMGVHPVEGGEKPHHRLYLMCDDIGQTVQRLKARGVEFIGDVADHGWGLLTRLKIPGGGEIGLYEPRHPRPSLVTSRTARGRKRVSKGGSPPKSRARQMTQRKTRRRGR